MSMTMRDHIGVKVCIWGLRIMTPRFRQKVDHNIRLARPATFAELVDTTVTTSLDDVVRELDIEEECHCGALVDKSEFRNRGMCTFCDDVRCDAFPGWCRR